MIDNRQNIINATERLLQTHGLARLTTREIARKAKVAEGLIYHHFKDKAELIYEVVETRVRETKNLMENLPLQVGTRTLSENLEEVLHVVYQSHYEIVPIICSMFADHQLRVRMQEIMKERNIGPQHSIEGLAVYLAAEQRLGRIRDAVDPQVIAKCLWMISRQSAMLDQLMGHKPNAAHVRQEIRNYVQTLMNGLEPHPKTEEKTDLKKSN
jgi:AcrR family transcriptional regulator